MYIYIYIYIVSQAPCSSRALGLEGVHGQARHSILCYNRGNGNMYYYYYYYYLFNLELVYLGEPICVFLLSCYMCCLLYLGIDVCTYIYIYTHTHSYNLLYYNIV